MNGTAAASRCARTGRLFEPFRQVEHDAEARGEELRFPELLADDARRRNERERVEGSTCHTAPFDWTRARLVEAERVIRGRTEGKCALLATPRNGLRFDVVIVAEQRPADVFEFGLGPFQHAEQVADSRHQR